MGEEKNPLVSPHFCVVFLLIFLDDSYHSFFLKSYSENVSVTLSKGLLKITIRLNCELISSYIYTIG